MNGFLAVEWIRMEEKVALEVNAIEEILRILSLKSLHANASLVSVAAVI